MDLAILEFLRFNPGFSLIRHRRRSRAAFVGTDQRRFSTRRGWIQGAISVKYVIPFTLFGFTSRSCSHSS
ncbi:MAG: hypothetical protein CMJ18_22815 [Phycisphaeraceae bacterium]|nr:hypothetical protein [Phycisphaeraceae bacterium]